MAIRYLYCLCSPTYIFLFSKLNSSTLSLFQRVFPQRNSFFCSALPLNLLLPKCNLGHHSDGFPGQWHPLVCSHNNSLFQCDLKECVLYTFSHYICFSRQLLNSQQRVSGIGEGGGVFCFKSTYNNKAIGYVKTEVDSNTTQHSFRVSQTTKNTVLSVCYSALMHLRLSKSSF